MKVKNVKRFSLKMLCCEARAFPVGTAYSYMISRPFFTPRKTRMRMNLDHVVSGHFALGRDILCKFNYWLAVSMHATQVCQQCKAAVPVRRKTCERRNHVFQSKQKAECNLWEKSITVLWLSWACHAHSIMFLPMRSLLTSFQCSSTSLVQLIFSFLSWFHTIQARRQVGFEGVRSKPPFWPPKDFTYTV